MKKRAFFDLDKTVFNGSSMQKFLFGYLIPQKKIKLFDLLEALLLVFRYATRLISHNNASKKTIDITARVLKGRSVAEVAEWQKDFFTENHFYSHIPKLFKYLEKNGYEIYIVSASILPVVQACADTLGVKSIASELVVVNGRYTGTIKHLMNEDEKAVAVSALIGEKKNYSLGFGDSTGDLSMLTVVEHGFLFEPFEVSLPSVAEQHGITIVDRTSILSEVKKVIRS